MPKISVIIPVYNGEKTIQKTIESVLQQTWQDFELIVINDGSQDATLEILSSIQDPRLRILSYSNAGLASSRNRGITEATGEYISFLDADDLWTPDKLEAQFQALEEHPEAAVAYSWTDYIDQSSQFLHSGRHITINGNVYQHLLVNNFLENGSNPLIRKQALNQVGGFDSSINSVADWDMWLRLAAGYQFVAVPLPQILYRVSARSMSSQIKNQERECLKVIEKAFKSAPESQQNLKCLSLSNLYKYLTFKAIEDSPSRQNAGIAAYCLWQYCKYKPELLLKPKIIMSVTIKIIFMFFKPK
ncbi:glycosyltransferase [Planktothrix agardhii 1806]|jgi:glycosyltransferase involved in cell wall biosynthesis|uniref:Glycosyl transferase, group 2 family protein n=2 Tax=Planktothrix agardhii TaxID=1160 RepID=A0A1J1JH65_PLAAG|nr:glycosyltransferase [Planktothrix agardhii]MCF3569051.1 glycosyltransferase [Planktothrix agardhii 1807]MCF3569508.1 glycosyltransferase [Planktothrix agardhii 1805]MCF3577120.1 glycosyltransferase [Planktothrix agardhii 1812]MCF3579609.1 glycosyltransferase [Planktothrix agardhii 1811]MCF3583524.1 glycosyltransferase [Planktothrix agardhii 1803]